MTLTTNTTNGPTSRPARPSRFKTLHSPSEKSLNKLQISTPLGATVSEFKPISMMGVPAKNYNRDSIHIPV